jgi:hypothetical protein
MLPVIVGKGSLGVRHGGDPGGVEDTVMIVVIASAAHAEAILAQAQGIRDGRTAILSMSDAQVMREDRV